MNLKDEEHFQRVLKVLGGTLGPGQAMMKKMIESNMPASNGVSLTHLGFNDLIIHSVRGDVFTAHNDLYETQVDGIDIVSRPHGSLEWHKCYNGVTDEFDFTGIQVYSKGTTSGGLTYPSIKLHEYHGGPGRKIRNHHTIFGAVFGYDVLLAMEEGPCDIHHIHGLEAGNGIDELQLLLSQDHQSLEKTLWWIRHRQQQFLENEFNE